jgi:hypothetical protein
MRLMVVTDSEEVVKAPRRGTALTHRLVTLESMAEALDGLLAGMRRYTLVIKRPAFSWDTGEFRSPNLVLHEDEKLITEGSIDPRLLKARQIVLLGTVPDGGTAKINLTSRTVEILAATQGLYKLIKSCNTQLERGAKSWWITAGGAWLMTFLPVLPLVLVYFLDSVTNPKIRYAMYVNSKASRPPYDSWANHLADVILVLWLAVIFVALIIGFIVLLSRPLGIWPKSLTGKPWRQILYQVRSSGAIPRNALFVVVSIMSAVIGGIVTAIISK